jgi:hypothetical protein
MSDQRLRLIWYPFCAITSSQMNLLANVVRSLPRLSTDPDLIARQRAVSPVRLAPPEPPLERCISVQDFRARFVCAEHSTARLNVTRVRKAVARERLITNCGLFKRLGCQRHSTLKWTIKNSWSIVMLKILTLCAAPFMAAPRSHEA